MICQPDISLNHFSSFSSTILPPTPSSALLEPFYQSLIKKADRQQPSFSTVTYFPPAGVSTYLAISLFILFPICYSIYISIIYIALKYKALRFPLTQST